MGITKRPGWNKGMKRVKRANGSYGYVDAFKSMNGWGDAFPYLLFFGVPFGLITGNIYIALFFLIALLVSFIRAVLDVCGLVTISGKLKGPKILSAQGKRLQKEGEKRNKYTKAKNEIFYWENPQKVYEDSLKKQTPPSPELYKFVEDYEKEQESNGCCHPDHKEIFLEWLKNKIFSNWIYGLEQNIRKDTEKALISMDPKDLPLPIWRKWYNYIKFNETEKILPREKQDIYNYRKDCEKALQSGNPKDLPYSIWREWYSYFDLRINI